MERVKNSGLLVWVAVGATVIVSSVGAGRARGGEPVCEEGPTNMTCANAYTIRHPTCTSDADCDGQKRCSGNLVPCTADTDCPPGHCSATTTTDCWHNVDCPAGEICEQAEACIITPEPGAGVCQDDGTFTGTSICTSVLVDFDNRCADTDGPATDCDGATSGLRNDVWYTYQPPTCSSQATVDACGLSTNDGFGAAYRASTAECPTLSQDQELACNDEGCGGAGPSRFSFLNLGASLIRYGGWNNEDLIGNPKGVGQFRLTVLIPGCDVIAPLAAAPPHNRTKNRYISFDPNPQISGNGSIAFEVLIDDGTGNDVHVGWVGPPGDGYSGASHCPNCCLVTDEANRAELSGDDWLAAAASGIGPVIHVGDCEIAPNRTYKVRIFDVTTGVGTPTLSIATTPAPNPGVDHWGDCVGPFGSYCSTSYKVCDGRHCDDGVFDQTATPCTTSGDCVGIGTEQCVDDPPCPGSETCIQQWPPADGSTNFTDVSASIRAFQQVGVVPETEWVDLHGAEATGNQAIDPPNHIVNFTDVQHTILAFQGGPYPFSDPLSCP